MSKVAFKDKYGYWPDLNQYTAWAVFSQELVRQELECVRDKLDHLDYRQRHTPVTLQAKCPCCGSRQYVYKQTARICAYCRSES